MIDATIGIMASLGLSIGPAAAVFILCSLYVFIAVTLLWVFGLSEGNHSIVDGYYGWAFASVGWLAYGLMRPVSATAALLLLMTSLHGCRLGYYLSLRWLGYRARTGGDDRYFKLKARFSPGYWWKSFVIVMHPQTAVIMLISLPAIFAICAHPATAVSLNWLSILGLAVFGIGLYYEWTADGQLQVFKADPANKGRYLETGVWALTRHPNYFGNATVWWGVWIVAVAENHGLWWTAIGPISNTVMLTKIYGTAFTDKHLADRPQYVEMMKRRGGFLPKLW